MPIQKHYYQCLYQCPVVELSGYTARYGLNGKLYAYLDFGGATGSAKDGLAEGMLALAVQKGRLQRGQTVVEAGSSSFAAALTLAARAAGHPVILAVPAATAVTTPSSLTVATVSSELANTGLFSNMHRWVASSSVALTRMRPVWPGVKICLPSM